MEHPDQVTASPDRDAHRLRIGLISTAVLAVLLLAIALAVPDLREVLHRVAHADGGWLVLAVGLEITSCLGYVATVRLVLNRGPAREVRWLAWVEMAFGAVVPIGGAGGLAVGAWAMRAWGIGWSRIADRSAVIFLLTSAVNGVVLILAGIGLWLGIGGGRSGVLYGLVPAIAVAAALAFFVLLPRGLARRVPSRGMRTVLSGVGRWVKSAEATASTPSWRLLGAVGYLLFDIAVLWACLRAVGTTAPVLALIVAYQIGYLANLLPIPGGLGALEGGLLGALLLYGLPAGPAAAAVILYHAIALWVPALGGTVAFARLRQSFARRGVPLAVLAPQAEPELSAGELAA